jgi:hypothetical protein
MWSRSQPSSTCADGPAVPGRSEGERGAAALLVALGTMVVMLLIAVTVGAQVRQELRMSRAEVDVTQVEALVTGAFQEAAARADADVYWPNPPDDGTSLCTPSGTSYPSICTQALARRSVSTRSGNRKEIPVRAVVKMDDASPPQAVYGWILIDPKTNKVMGVYYYHRWCTYPSPPTNPSQQPCEQGG